MAKFTQEQLQHYLDHPEEIDATNAELVNALALMDGPVDGITANPGKDPIAPVENEDEKALREAEEAERKDTEEARAEADRKIAADEAVVKATKTGKVEEEGKTGTETDEGKPVLTKDGKHAIPHAVLADARERANAAEQALAEAQQTLVQLTKGARTAERPQVSQVQEQVTKLRDLAGKVKDEAPWLSDLAEQMVGAIELALDGVGRLSHAHVQSEQEVVADLRRDAADAKESNPTLVLWESQHPDLFQEAMVADKFLRESNRERYSTFEDRFNAAVKVVIAQHDGEDLPLPEEVAPAAAGTARPAATTSDVKDRAKALIAKATKESVRTLTDIPTGAGELTQGEALDRMSMEESAAKFSQMTPQQIINWVSTH